MIAVLKFFSDYSVVVFLLLLVGGIFAVRGLGRARAEKTEAVFILENELAQRHLRQSTAILVTVLLLVLSEFVVVVFLTPILPELTLNSQSDGQLSVIPTHTIPAEIMQTLNASTPAATSTVTISGCIPAQIMLTFPAPGQEVSGKITLIGSADIPNFGFYKYEFSPIGMEIWSTIQAGRDVIQNDDLGIWDTSELTPGDYLLRLVITDNQGDVLPACVVPIRIKAP